MNLNATVVANDSLYLLALETEEKECISFLLYEKTQGISSINKDFLRIMSISMSLSAVKMTANATAASEDGLLNDNEEGR